MKEESVGYYLKRTREIREISLEEVSKKTKISIRFLSAIEEEKWDILPGEVFIKGFIRTYSQLLGLNPDEIVEKYLQERAKDQKQYFEEEKKEKKKFPLLLVSLIAIFFIGIFFFVFLSFKDSKKEEKNVKPEEEKVEVLKEEVKEPEKVIKEENSKLELLFSRHCWVRVEVDGQKVFEGFKEAGDKLDYSYKESFTLKVGDAGALQVIKDGVLQQKLGEDGQPVLYKIP